MRPRSNILIACTALIIFSTVCGLHNYGAKRYSDVVPEKVGLSSEQLNRITEQLKEDVQKGVIPGAVALIARRGRIPYLVSVGMQSKDAGTPMSRDSIFRIYSMTKPITSVAVLMLYEEGRLRLDDPVSRYLPEFGRMRVGVEIIDEKTGNMRSFSTVPAKRRITIRDLLMHTSGLTYGIFGSSAVKAKYNDAGINGYYQTLEEFTDKLAKLPLAYQPGATWEYSRSTDVLGRVIEVVSDMPLDRFLEKRIFLPLGMKDTGFYVKKEKLGRVAQSADGSLSNVAYLPRMLSGGGGLVSTVDDYMRFLQMLLNCGELEGKRLLKRETVALMTRDHLGPLSNRKDPWYLPGWGYGFGLGVAVRMARDAWKPGTVGDYYWGGYAGTYFLVDPSEELIAIFMIQEPSKRLYYRGLFTGWVYRSITERREK